MIAKIANRGTSFKGAGQYYLHDKREEGEKIRTSSERVAWTETRNLASNDPDFSLKIMAATAINKDRLKEQAGVKKTGRKSKGEVMAYSLAWHPDEQGKFNKAEMLQAADQSLKALGAHKHQALIVAHQDEKHPHIHIIVNMVNPENGKNLNVSNDRKKLHKWSNDYRKTRGEEHLFCPKKAKKFEAIEDKKRGHKLPYMNDGKDEPRHLNKSFKSVKDVNQNDLKTAKRRESAKDAALSKDGRKMAASHSDQWAKLSEKHQSRKKEIGQQYKQDKQEARASVKAQMKPAFRDLHQQHREEQKAFETRETRVSGKLHNMMDAIKFANVVRGEESPNLLTKIQNTISDAGKRSAWLKEKHASQTRRMTAEQNGQIKDGTKLANEQRKRRLKSSREDFKNGRDTLIGQQGAEKEDLKDRWKSRNKQRQQAVKSLQTKARIAPRDEKLLPEKEKLSVREQFKEGVDNEQKRTRSRSRKRTRDD